MVTWWHWTAVLTRPGPRHPEAEWWCVGICLVYSLWLKWGKKLKKTEENIKNKNMVQVKLSTTEVLMRRNKQYHKHDNWGNEDISPCPCHPGWRLVVTTRQMKTLIIMRRSTGCGLSLSSAMFMSISIRGTVARSQQHYTLELATGLRDIDISQIPKKGTSRAFSFSLFEAILLTKP